MTKLARGLKCYEERAIDTFVTRKSLAYVLNLKGFPELNDWERKECLELISKFVRNMEKDKRAKLIAKFTREI